MKRFRSLFAATVHCLSVGLIMAMLPLDAQEVKPASNSPLKTTLDENVATVGKREISKREILAEYLSSEPEMIQAFNEETYPKDKVPKSLDQIAFWNYLSQKFPMRLRDAATNLIFYSAVEEVATGRGIVVTEREVRERNHANLEVRRKSAELPAELTDEQLSAKFNESLTRSLEMMRRYLLMDRLVLADLNDRLGHPITDTDYLQVSLIEIRANPKPKAITLELDLDNAKERLLAIRADILAGKMTFGEAAQKESADGSAKRGGKLLPMPKTLLKTGIEKGVLAIKPGELTPPIFNGNGYVLLRLEKIGSQLTEKERKDALTAYLGTRKRHDDALAKMLDEVKWQSTLGEMPQWVKKYAEAQKNGNKVSTK